MKIRRPWDRVDLRALRRRGRAGHQGRAQEGRRLAEASGPGS